MRLQYFHPEIIPLMLATPLMIFFNMKGNINGMIIVFWSCFAIDLVLVFRFLYFTINQLTSHLGIYCFSLKKAKKEWWRKIYYQILSYYKEHTLNIHFLIQKSWFIFINIDVKKKKKS